MRAASITLLSHDVSNANMRDQCLDGFQLLHAVHIVETLLFGFLQRKCVFHVAFFDDHASGCVPINALSSQAYKYKLARAAVIRHLQINVPSNHPQVQIESFPSLESSSFSKYLQNSGAYFMMCHDGALTTSIAHDGSNPKIEAAQKLFRAAIAFFMSEGYNVALINDLEFRDTKVLDLPNLFPPHEIS